MLENGKQAVFCDYKDRSNIGIAISSTDITVTRISPVSATEQPPEPTAQELQLIK